MHWVGQQEVMATGRSPSQPKRQVLEKVDRRACLDDTIPLQATITTYRILQSHVEYTVRVQRGPSADNSWDVSHRYNDFTGLQQLLQVSTVAPSLPPKKWMGNTDRKFLNERQEKLQEYLNNILLHPMLALSLPTRRFLDPTNYAEDFHERALRTASMFFRSNPEYSVVESLKDIGWRCRKHYYLMASKIEPKAPKTLLSLCEPGIDCSLGEKELELALKYLVDLKHPLILSPKSAAFTGSALMVVRDFFPRGSLRDMIYEKKPGQHYLMKYTSALPVPRSSLTEDQVKKYGWQVLEALQFLLEKGFVIGHVHAGNVIVDQGVCRLTDLENSLLGLPHVYRHFIYSHDLRKIQTTEAEAVYSFGHMLYEMSCGEVLRTAMMQAHPPSMPHETREFLQSILSSSAIKALPTISDLLANPYFSEVRFTYDKISSKPFKVSRGLKEALKISREKSEARLQEQHRMTSQSRRISRAHDSLMSDEKKKERRKKIKKQMSQQSTNDDGDAAYPTTKLTKPPTTPSTTPSAATNGKTKSSKPSSSSSTSSAPPPPSPVAKVEAKPRAGERGALLGSIEGFTKGKLKKTVTNDRSAPLISR